MVLLGISGGIYWQILHCNIQFLVRVKIWWITIILIKYNSIILLVTNNLTERGRVPWPFQNWLNSAKILLSNYVLRLLTFHVRSSWPLLKRKEKVPLVENSQLRLGYGGKFINKQYKQDLLIKVIPSLRYLVSAGSDCCEHWKWPKEIL